VVFFLSFNAEEIHECCLRFVKRGRLFFLFDLAVLQRSFVFPRSLSALALPQGHVHGLRVSAVGSTPQPDSISPIEVTSLTRLRPAFRRGRYVNLRLSPSISSVLPALSRRDVCKFTRSYLSRAHPAVAAPLVAHRLTFRSVVRTLGRQRASVSLFRSFRVDSYADLTSINVVFTTPKTVTYNTFPAVRLAEAPEHSTMPPSPPTSRPLTIGF